MSFHATKAFATGEGGCVASSDIGLVERIGQALNFGFSGSRDSAAPSLNGKLSEYHAAVGLAQLAEWDAKQEATARVLDLYREGFERLGMAGRLICAPEVASLYVLFAAETQHEADDVAASLAEDGISHRLWYRGGLQTHAQYARLSSDPLPVTTHLASRLLGLPFAVDLDERDVKRIIAAVAQGVECR
jgi:dTDP-4-amino-4,6-dideoxygalactose transaminase